MKRNASFFRRDTENDAAPTTATAKRRGKRSGGEKAEKVKAKSKAALGDESDEEIASDDDEIEANGRVDSAESDKDEVESAQEKRLRLAKVYLNQIERNEKERSDNAEITKAVIANRLHEDILESAGRLHHDVADSLLPVCQERIRFLRGHKLSATCVALSPDNRFVYSASKDGAIIKWCGATGARLRVVPLLRDAEGSRGHTRHTKPVTSLALSSDGKLLVSGGGDGKICVWSPGTMELLQAMHAHRKPVTGVAFRRNTLSLYSGAEDRLVKVWNLAEFAYVETLFGHEDAVSSIDAAGPERALTGGSRDNSVRLWKIPEESQLVYAAEGQGGGSVDCVRFLDDEHFVSAGDTGSLLLWHVGRKKPQAVVRCAHGCQPGTGVANWIASLAAYHNTDLVASGSCDGFVRLWKCDAHLVALQAIPVSGFVNWLQFSADGSHLAAAVGQEHRLGRWWKLRDARNCVCLVPLARSDSNGTG